MNWGKYFGAKNKYLRGAASQYLSRFTNPADDTLYVGARGNFSKFTVDPYSIRNLRVIQLTCVYLFLSQCLLLHYKRKSFPYIRRWPDQERRPSRHLRYCCSAHSEYNHFCFKHGESELPPSCD